MMVARAADGADGRAARASRWPLGIILALYFWLAHGYAYETPAWQVPDEPAHYNNIFQRMTARPGESGPIIEAGDYPFAKLEELKDLEKLKAQRNSFGPSTDILGIEYEDHQPPAYYDLAATVLNLYAAAIWMVIPDIGHLSVLRVDYADDPNGGFAVFFDLIVLRFLGILLGALTILLAWASAGAVAPSDLALRVGVTSFAAFLPMQLAMNASVNNDPLAFAVTAGALLVALRRVAGESVDDGRPDRWPLGAGLLVGLAALTKLTALAPALALLVGAELLRSRSPRAIAKMLLVALIVASPWLAHNVTHYGWADPLALAAHDRATACPPGTPVGCQPRTADWIADKGLGDFLLRGAEFTFKSFWGVFGWMAVFLGSVKGIPIYGTLALSSLVALAGAVVLLRRASRWPAPLKRQAALLALHLAITVAAFLWYNLSFVQHQGRYLLPALVPIALAYSAGLRESATAILGRLGVAALTARRLGDMLLIAHSAALAGLAWLSLRSYIIPGL